MENRERGLVSKKQPNDEAETTDDEETPNSKKNNLQKPKKSEFEEKIRVGKDYQANILPQKSEPDNYPDKALLVWSPAKDIPDSELEEYATQAKEQFGYNAEQALGLLFWNQHDIKKAFLDLANFTPFPDEWTKEDKVLFAQAFQFHGKSFHRIRQMLPDKSIANLVKFYYSWKKTRSRSSVMDRQEKKKTEVGSENSSENGSLEDSDWEDKKWPIRGIRRTSRSPNCLHAMNSHTETEQPSSSTASKTSVRPIQESKRPGNLNGASSENKDTGYSSSSSSSNGLSKMTSLNCHNCTVLCNELKDTVVGRFCLSCFHHWRRTGVMRPTQGPQNIPPINQRPRSKTNKLYYYQGYHDGSSKYKRKPPKGMYINHDDVVKLAKHDLKVNESPQRQCFPRNGDLLAETERQVTVLYSQIQKNKQKISSFKSRNDQIRDMRLPEEIALTRVNQRWTKDEIFLVNAGFRKFGLNFKAIAELLGTKTESHIRKYCNKTRKSKDLDAVNRESRVVAVGNVKKAINEEIMEIESDEEMKVLPATAKNVKDLDCKTYDSGSVRNEPEITAREDTENSKASQNTKSDISIEPVTKKVEPEEMDSASQKSL